MDGQANDRWCVATRGLAALSSRLFLLAQIVAVIATSFLFPNAAFPTDTKLYPSDEAPKDPSFVEFRNRLIRAAETRNIEFIVSVLDPRVVNDFGGEGGIEEFKSKWSPDKPESKLWETLRLILRMGGSYYASDPEPEFWAPYVYSRWPKEFDSFEYAAVTAASVRVRSQPDLNAPVVATLSFDVVKFGNQDWSPMGEAGPNSWVKIVTLAGVEGYVSSRYVRSPIDYRIGFVSKSGKWSIKVFVAGD
jgi:hypothetical protein